MEGGSIFVPFGKDHIHWSARRRKRRRTERWAPL